MTPYPPAQELWAEGCLQAGGLDLCKVAGKTQLSFDLSLEKQVGSGPTASRNQNGGHGVTCRAGVFSSLTGAGMGYECDMCT